MLETTSEDGICFSDMSVMGSGQMSLDIWSRVVRV